MNVLVKIWLNIGILGRIKLAWYLVSVVVMSLVSVWFRFVIFLKVASLIYTRYLTRDASVTRHDPGVFRSARRHLVCVASLGVMPWGGDWLLSCRRLWDAPRRENSSPTVPAA